MSSILKALKKVEDVQPEPRRTENWSHAFDSREAIRKQARRSRTVRAGLAVLCAAVFLGVGGWWLYGQWPRSGGMAGPAGRAGAGDREMVTAAPEQPAEIAPAASRPVPARPAQAEPPAKPSLQAGAAAVARPAPKSPAPRDEAPAPDPPAASGEAGPPERLDTSRYRLEAIVWASDPGSRFAVINGSILRQGGTMDGLSVTTIERNSVKLRSGNKIGEIRFNRD